MFSEPGVASGNAPTNRGTAGRRPAPPKKSLDFPIPWLYFVEMAKGDFLGEFEQIILLAVLRLADDAYGMEVRREIEARAGRDASIGAVYATLDRLEAKGLVRSREQTRND